MMEMGGASGARTILQDLVDDRLEAPTVEYKRWMPLSDALARANIARHICALANAGGGYLVFGFEDDGFPSEPHPADLKDYSQDVVNGIVDKYLQPQVHCATVVVKASSGREYPVVRIPGHGAQPICAKRDGPQDDKHRPRGILAGTHYIRAPGPKSIPIDTPERWREVIHRCVVAERDGLLSSIGRLFDRPTDVKETSLLEPWVDEALEEWATIPNGEWPLDHTVNRVAFGFRLIDSSGATPPQLSVQLLQQAIRTASFAAADEVRTGATPFEMTWTVTSKPSVALFGDIDGYDMKAASITTSSIDELWRVTASGLGVDVQPFAEDSPWIRSDMEGRSSRRWAAGTKMSPKFQITHLAERVAFVRRFAAAFEGVTECELLVDYAGLPGRNVEEPATGHCLGRNYTAAAKGRRVPKRFAIEALVADMPGVIAALIGPIFRLFDGWDVGPDHVRDILANPR